MTSEIPTKSESSEKILVGFCWNELNPWAVALLPIAVYDYHRIKRGKPSLSVIAGKHFKLVIIAEFILDIHFFYWRYSERLFQRRSNG